MHDADNLLNEPVAKVDDPSTNKNTIRIAILIDESGSMLGAAESTVTQLNSYLDEQATKDEPTLVSVYTFNSRGVPCRFRSINAKDAPRLSRNNALIENPTLDHNLIYAPSGGTPLWDAIGTVISEEASDMPTLVVILTDGEENESKEYRTLESIQTLIKAQEDRGWTFTFLMAGLSRAQSVQYASRIMGRAYGDATMSYSKGLEGQAFHALDSATKKWAGVARAAAASDDDDAYVKLRQTASKNFFDEGTRDIRKKDDK